MKPHIKFFVISFSTFLFLLASVFLQQQLKKPSTTHTVVTTHQELYEKKFKITIEEASILKELYEKMYDITIPDQPINIQEAQIVDSDKIAVTNFSHIQARRPSNEKLLWNTDLKIREGNQNVSSCFQRGDIKKTLLDHTSDFLIARCSNTINFINSHNGDILHQFKLKDFAPAPYDTSINIGLLKMQLSNDNKYLMVYTSHHIKIISMPSPPSNFFFLDYIKKILNLQKMPIEIYNWNGFDTSIQKHLGNLPYYTRFDGASFSDVRFSEDGTQVFAASEKHLFKWSLATGQLSIDKHSLYASSRALVSADGQYYWTCNLEGIIFNKLTSEQNSKNEIVRNFEFSTPKYNSNGEVRYYHDDIRITKPCKTSPNGELIAMWQANPNNGGSGSKIGLYEGLEVHVYNSDGSPLIDIVETEQPLIKDIMFSGDSKSLALITEKGEIRIYDLVEKRLSAKGRVAPVNNLLAINQDGSTLLLYDSTKREHKELLLVSKAKIN